MRVASILEHASAFVMQLESTCTHPKASASRPQSHLIVAEVTGDAISYASVWTMLFGPPDAHEPLRRELEDPRTLSPERERSATCTIDSERESLADFRGYERTVWATPSCTVLTVKSPTQHDYVEIDCTPHASCDPSRDSKRYFDWNGWRILPFADETYVEK